ncbi:MAG: hypothetical protein NTZ76_00830 [Actinobacteria bacterium]|nr:hypothetical protein [Actinomycetota bacterium]
MSDPTEVALTYEVEQKFSEAMPTRTLLMSEASTWLRDICEQEDLDVPHLDSHALPQRIEAVAIAETWCILVNGVAPTQHTILHELAHLSQLVSYIRRYISLEHAALLHSLFVNAQLSVEPFSATR